MKSEFTIEEQCGEYITISGSLFILDGSESSNSQDSMDGDMDGSVSEDSSAKENEPGRSRGRNTEEYHRRRERNNMAVRKSRNKAKQRQKESARRLQELTAENKRLQMKAELLMKELNLLKGLFPIVGITPPPEVDVLLAG